MTISARRPAGDTTLGVEQLRPLFHLFNGDLCYANLAADRVRTWWDFWANNTRSARNRPWMPSPGNHENELGNGPIGYQAYQTYFSVPDAAGQTDVTRGLWYAFTAGSVRVISIANDDVAYQDGGNSYVRGYSSGAQKAWLEKELAATRENRDIDWVVVCMHQVAISTVDKFNGADLGIREEWVPLFDKYNVDLVVCGHEHHYERSHPIRGQEENQTLTPKPASVATDVIDTTKGTVHMVIGGGGTSVPSNELFFNPPACRVIVSVGSSPDPATGKRPPVYVQEDAPWSAVRNAAHAYGFAAFTVDPGSERGGFTTMKVVYYDVVGPGGQLAAFETFTLRRPRRDRYISPKWRLSSPGGVSWKCNMLPKSTPFRLRRGMRCRFAMRIPSSPRRGGRPMPAAKAPSIQLSADHERELKALVRRIQRRKSWPSGHASFCLPQVAGA